MDRDERLMAVLASRLLESNKKVGETAEAIELRQSGEHNSVLSNIALSVSEPLSQVLRWAYWWNSTEESPDDVTSEQVTFELIGGVGFEHCVDLLAHFAEYLHLLVFAARRMGWVEKLL